MKLQGLSILDKKQKVRTKQLAERYASQVDLEDVFKEEPKKEKDVIDI